MRFLSTILLATAMLSSASASSSVNMVSDRYNPLLNIELSNYQQQQSSSITDAMAHVGRFFQQYDHFNLDNFQLSDVSTACLQAFGDFQATLVSGCTTAPPTAAGTPTTAAATTAAAAGTTMAASTAAAAGTTMAASTAQATTAIATTAMSTTAAPPATPNIIQQLATLCASPTCQTTVKAKLSLAQTTCANSGTLSPQGQAVISGLAQLSNYINYGCTADTGGSCIAQFLTAAATAQNTPALQNPLKNLITTAQLNALCTPCTLKVVAALGASPTATTLDIQASAGLELLCIMDTENPAPGLPYCVQTLEAAAKANPTVTPTDFPGYYCSTCFEKVSAASAFVGTQPPASQVAQFNAAAKLLCVQGPSNMPCAAYAPALTAAVANAANTLAGPCAAALTTGTCTMTGTGNCHDAVNAALGPFGCCFATLFNLPTSAGQTQSALAALVPKVLAACGLSALGTTQCAYAATSTVVTLDVPNLLYSFYSKNTATITASLTADIAFAAGVSSTQVTVTGSAEASPGTGTMLSATIITTANYLNAAAAAQLNSQLTAGTMSFPATALYISTSMSASTALASPTSPIVANSGTASTQAGTGGPAVNPTTAGTGTALAVSITGILATVMAALALVQ